MKLTNLAIAAVLTLAASGAEAQTVYSSRSDWLSHVTGVTTTSFNGVVPSGWFGSVGSIDGVDYTVDGESTLIVYDAAFIGDLAFDGAAGTGLNGFITARFGAPVSAFGFDFGGRPGGQYSITTSTGFFQTFDYTLGGGGYSFFGFTGGAPISWIEIGMVGGWGLIDNFSFTTQPTIAPTPNDGPNQNEGLPNDDEPQGPLYFEQELEMDVPMETTVTPEPGSFALLAAGLAGVIAVRRRRNRAVATS